ncbi:ABC transporter permease [Pseudomonas sp. BGr12]|uniref:ABC transporter permease n=1 Tax=unclassified Pseudomonas TaxID=196821 RepID=UPI0017858672|nr:MULTISPECIES: ABC transporter permease [unclassified Pseudomonas]MBD9502275.1 ABC transporter permease [Pseudomonas sp. PDM17]MBD9577139.1 ABC transporter permease [Pseudomonas sp. PDM23]MBD9671288.1 ABC transporter permease [Pseudomonas sp. PDM21]MDL2429035.1 ABC transporter permease [Pseudomonas sp. BJa5]
MSRTFDRLSWFASPLLLLLAWFAVARAGWFPPQLLVPPAEVWASFQDLLASGELREHVVNSLSRLAIGFSIGAVGGLLLGTAMALSKNVEAYCAPLFHTLRQVPSIALIPMFILFFGVEETFKVLIVTKAAFFPVALAASEGVKGIPRSYFEVASVYRLPLWSLLRDVAFPAAAPPIVTGLRISLSRAWMVLVAAELLAADSGLGQMIELSRQMLRIDIVMVGVVVTGAIGFVLDFAFRLLEKRLLRWRPTP